MSGATVIVDALQTDPLLREQVEAYLAEIERDRTTGYVYGMQVDGRLKIGFTSPRHARLRGEWFDATDPEVARWVADHPHKMDTKIPRRQIPLGKTAYYGRRK